MSHRRMSAGARCHLLRVVEALAAPTYCVMVSGGKLADGAVEKIRRFIEGRPNFHSVVSIPFTGGDTSKIGVVSTGRYPKPVVRVCAGKGGGRRGIHGGIERQVVWMPVESAMTATGRMGSTT